MAIPYTAAQLNNGVVSASVLASYTAADWAQWAQSNSANTFSALSSSVLGRISVAVLNTLTTTTVSGFNPLVVQQRTVMAITNAQFTVWLASGPTSVSTNHFLGLTAQTLFALHRATGAPLNSAVLAQESAIDSKNTNLWVQWWNHNIVQRSLLAEAVFASAFTAARIQRMWPAGVTQAQFDAWLNSPSNQLADLTYSGLNILSLTSPNALTGAAMTTARFQSWMVRGTQTGFHLSNNFRDLMPATIGALARSAGDPLSAPSLTAAKFNEWFAAQGNLADMGAVTLNALARNPDRLLSIGSIGQSQFNGWLGNPNHRFTDLTVQAVNEMSSVFTAASTPASLSALATLMGPTDVLWDSWWRTRTSERASLDPAIFAAVFHPARLNAMIAADQRAVTQAQFAGWLARDASRLAALSASTLNELVQNAGAALASTALNQATFNAWVLAQGGARLTSLTAATLNALAQNPNALLSADGINPSRFAAWLQGGGSTTSVGRFASLTIATINALALNPQSPLSTTALEAGRFNEWLGAANNQNLRLLSAAALDALARNPGALLSSGGLTQAKFAAWLDANASAASGFASLAAATVNALAANPNLLLQASPLTASSSSLWTAWWAAHAHDRASLGAATFANAMTAARLNTLSAEHLASVTCPQAVAWLLAPGNTLADLNATVLNAWARSADGRLMAPELTQSMFSAWVARTESGQSRLAQLSAATLNALAANPNRLLGAAALGATQLNAWLLAQPFAQLSAVALNMLSAALAVPANSTGLTSLADLTNSGSDARWTDWWSAPASDRRDLAADLFARSFGNTRLNRLSAQDLSDVVATQFSAWLGRLGNSFSVLQASTLNGLAPTVLAAVTPVQFSAWLQVDAPPQGGLNMGRAFNRLTAATLNALARNPGALQAVDADTLLSWCLTDRTRFVGLSALALNAMAGAVGIAAGRGLGSWLEWWRAHAVDRAALDPALFANYSIFGSTQLDQMDAQDLSGVAPAQLRAWLAQNQLHDLSAATFNALMPQWSDPSVAALLAQSGSKLASWWLQRGSERTSLSADAFARWFGVGVLNQMVGAVPTQGPTRQQFAAWLAWQDNRFADLNFRAVNVLLTDRQAAALVSRPMLLHWLGAPGNVFGALSQQVRGHLADAGMLTPPPLVVDLGPGRLFDGRFVINSNQVVVSNLDFGAIWRYSLDGGVRWTTGVGNRLALPPQDGRYQLRIHQTNFAFYEGSTDLSLVLDQVAPGVPTLRLVQDSGASSQDGITVNGTVQIAGLENDARWEYSLNQGATWLVGSGTELQLQAQGQHTVLARQTDAAGNQSGVQQLVFTLDSVAAAAPQLSLADDTGPSATDGISRSNRVLVSALEDGSSWQYSLDDGQTWSSPRTSVGSTAEFALQADGVYRIRVRQTDTAGNSATSVVLPMTLVRSAPGAVRVLLQEDTGLSGTDGVTSRSGLRFVVADSASTAWGVGTVVQYRFNDEADWRTLQGAPAQLPGDGTHMVHARAVDAAGNVGPTTASRWVLDRFAAAPTLALHSDTGASSTDLVTSVGQINVTGLENAAIWQYSVDNGEHWTTGGIGNSFGVTRPGRQTVWVRQQDAAGNFSVAASLTFTLMQSIPGAPRLTLLQDTGTSAVDRLTRNGVVAVSGLDAGATWQYTLDDGATWLGATTVDGIAAFRVQANGQYRARVRQIDLAGNVGLASDVLAFELDTVAPSVALKLRPQSGLFHTSAPVELDGAASLLPTDRIRWTFTRNGVTTNRDGGSTFDAYLGGQVQVTVSDAAGNQRTQSLDLSLGAVLDMRPEVPITASQLQEYFKDPSASLQALNVVQLGAVQAVVANAPHLSAGPLSSLATLEKMEDWYRAHRDDAGLVAQIGKPLLDDLSYGLLDRIEAVDLSNENHNSAALGGGTLDMLARWRASITKAQADDADVLTNFFGLLGWYLKSVAAEADSEALGARTSASAIDSTVELVPLLNPDKVLSEAFVRLPRQIRLTLMGAGLTYSGSKLAIFLIVGGVVTAVLAELMVSIFRAVQEDSDNSDDRNSNYNSDDSDPNSNDNSSVPARDNLGLRTISRADFASRYVHEQPFLRVSEIEQLAQNRNGVLNMWDASHFLVWMNEFTHDNGLRRLSADALNALSSMTPSTAAHPALGTALGQVSAQRLASWLANHGMPMPGTAPSNPMDASRLTDWSLATVLGLQRGIAGLDVALRSRVVAAWMVAHTNQIEHLPDTLVTYLTVADMGVLAEAAGWAVTQSQFNGWLLAHPPSIQPDADGVQRLSLQALRNLAPRVLGLSDAELRSQTVGAWVLANSPAQAAQLPNDLFACLQAAQINALSAEKLALLGFGQWDAWLAAHPETLAQPEAAQNSFLGLSAAVLVAAQAVILATYWARTALEPSMVAWLLARSGASATPEQAAEIRALPAPYVAHLSLDALNALSRSATGTKSAVSYLSDAQLDAWLAAHHGFSNGGLYATVSLLEEFACRQWFYHSLFKSRLVESWLKGITADEVSQLSPATFARFVEIDLFDDLLVQGSLDRMTPDQLAVWLLQYRDGLANISLAGIEALVPTILAMARSSHLVPIVGNPRDLAMDSMGYWLKARGPEAVAEWPQALFAISRVADLDAFELAQWSYVTSEQFIAWVDANPASTVGTGLAALKASTVLAIHATPALHTGLVRLPAWLAAWTLQHPADGDNGLSALLAGLGNVAAAALIRMADLKVWASHTDLTLSTQLVMPIATYLHALAKTHQGDPFSALFFLNAAGEVEPVLTNALLADADQAGALAVWLGRWVTATRTDQEPAPNPSPNHLRQLPVAMVRAMGAGLLNQLPSNALAQLSAAQWAHWRAAPGHHYGALTVHTMNQMQTQQLQQLAAAEWQAWLQQGGAPHRAESLAHLSLPAFACLSDDAVRGLASAAALSDVLPAQWEQWLNAHADTAPRLPVSVLNALPASMLEQYTSAQWLAWMDAGNALADLAPQHFARALDSRLLGELAYSLADLGKSLGALVGQAQWDAWHARNNLGGLDASTVSSLGPLLAGWSAHDWLVWVNGGTADQPHLLSELGTAALRAIPMEVWNRFATGLVGPAARTVIDPLSQMSWQLWKSYFDIGGGGTGSWENVAGRLSPALINAMGAQAGELGAADWNMWLQQMGQTGFNALDAEVVAASLRTLAEVHTTGTPAMDLGSLLGSWAKVAGHDLGQLGDALVQRMLPITTGLALMQALRSQGVLDQLSTAQWTQWMGHKVSFGGVQRSALARLDAPFLNALSASAWLAVDVTHLMDWAQTGHRYADLSAGAWNTFFGNYLDDADATDAMVLLYQLGTDGQRSALQRLCSASTPGPMFQALDARALNAVAALANYAAAGASAWRRPVVGQWLAWATQAHHALSQLGGVLVQGFSASDWSAIASFSTDQEPGLGASLLAQISDNQWRAWLQGDGDGADAVAGRFETLGLDVLNTWSADVLGEVPQAAWSAWLEQEHAFTLATADVVNEASRNGLQLESGWLAGWRSSESGHRLRDLAADVFNVLPPRVFAELEADELNDLADSTLAGIDKARWEAWLSDHDTQPAHAALHAHVVHALLQAHPLAVEAVLANWLEGPGTQTLAQKTQRFATLDAAVLCDQWGQLEWSFDADWMAALAAWGQQQPGQIDQLGMLFVSRSLPLEPLRDLIADLGTRAHLTLEQWKRIDERASLMYGPRSDQYADFYTDAMLSAMPESQRTILAQAWQGAPEMAARQLPHWRTAQLNMLPVELLAHLSNAQGWSSWGRSHAVDELGAHVINAAGSALWALLDIPDAQTGVARWSDWLEKAQAGHFLEQLSAATLAHILTLTPARAGTVRDNILAMDAAQWSQIAANPGSDLADLDPTTVARLFDADTLNALTPRALGQLSAEQWCEWRVDGGSLLKLSTSTVAAMHPSVVRSTVGGTDVGSVQAFTVDDWLALAAQSSLGSLGAVVTSQFSANVLNLLQQGGNARVDATLDMTPAQWFAWKLVHAEPDGSVRATGLSLALQTRLQEALSPTHSVPSWSEYQFARNAFSEPAQRQLYDQWVIGQGDSVAMREFVHAFTELSEGLATADVQALAGLLAQAKDANGARGVLAIIGFVHAAYPSFSSVELAQGLTGGSGELGLGRVLDVLSQGAKDAGLDAAAFRADWASLLEAAPAGLTRLAMIAHVTYTIARGSTPQGAKDLVLDIRNLPGTQGELRAALAELRRLPSPQGLTAFQDVTNDIVGAAGGLMKFFDGLPRIGGLIIGQAFSHRHLMNYLQSGLERTNALLKDLVSRRMVNTDAVAPAQSVPGTIDELVLRAHGALAGDQNGVPEIIQKMSKADFSYSNLGLRILGERVFAGRMQFSYQPRVSGEIPPGQDIGAALSMAVIEMATYKSVLSSPKYRGDITRPVEVPAVGGQTAYVIPAVNSPEFQSATPAQLKQWAAYLYGTPQGQGYSDLQTEMDQKVATAQEQQAIRLAAAQQVFDTAYTQAKSRYQANLKIKYEADLQSIRTTQEVRTREVNNLATQAAEKQFYDDVARAKTKLDQAVLQLSTQLSEQQEAMRVRLVAQPDGSMSAVLMDRYHQWLAGLSRTRVWAYQTLGGGLSNVFERDPERLRLIREDAQARSAEQFRERNESLLKTAAEFVIAGSSYSTDMEVAELQFRQSTQPLVLSPADQLALDADLASQQNAVQSQFESDMEAAQRMRFDELDRNLHVEQEQARREFEAEAVRTQEDIDRRAADRLFGTIRGEAPLVHQDQLELYTVLKRIQYNQAVADQTLFLRNAYQGQRMIASLVFGLQESAAQWGQYMVTNDQGDALNMRLANTIATTASTLNMPLNMFLSTLANRQKNLLAGDTQSNAFLGLLADYVPYTRSGWQKYKALSQGATSAWEDYWSCYELSAAGAGKRVVTLGRRRSVASAAAHLPTPAQMAQELTQAFGKLRAGQENKAFAFKQGNELRWGLMKNTAAFLNDASQAVAAYYTWKYVTSDDGPKDFRSSTFYQMWLLSTVVGNAAMATTDLVLDAAATGHWPSRLSLYVNLVGNASNVAFGLYAAHGLIQERHASGITNEAQYQIELSAFWVRAGLQMAEYGLTAASVLGLGPTGLAATVALFCMPAISALTMAVFGPNASGYLQAQALRDYAKTLGSEVDSDIYDFLATRAQWGAVGANIVGGWVSTAEAAQFYARHDISANGNYIRRGTIERMQAFAQGKSLSSLDIDHPDRPPQTDTRMVTALTSVATELALAEFAYGEMVFLIAATQRFQIGSENYVDASGVFEFDYHQMQGATTQASVTLDTADMQASGAEGWSGNGWAGNAASVSALTEPERGVGRSWFGISNGMSRSVYGLATVIKPHIVDTSRAAVVLIARGRDGRYGNDYTGTIYVDARDLPEGSLIILVDPTETGIKIITNGTPGAPQNLLVDAQNKDAAGPTEPRPNARQVVQWSSARGSEFVVNLDAFGDNLLLQGGQGNERLFGEANDLQYLYGGGDVTLTLSGSRNLMYVGIGANALLLGNACSLQVNSDRVSTRVGQFVSYGTNNSLDFQANVGGLVFENYAGIVDIRRNTAGAVSAAPDQGVLAQARGFATLQGTQGRDRYVVVGVQAGTQQALNLFGGDGDNTFDINTSSGVAIALGAGGNTVNLRNALATSVETFAETATSAELFTSGVTYAVSSIHLSDHSYLTATLRGVDSVFMGDETESEAILMVDGGIHNIVLRGQELALYVDATESSTTWVNNYLRDAEGNDLDEATRSQLIDIQGRNDTRIALSYDEAAKTLFLATFADDGSLLSELSLSGNVDDDMVLSYDTLVRRADSGLAMGSGLRSSVAASVLVDALAQADASAFMSVTDRKHETRSMAWLYNIFAPA